MNRLSLLRLLPVLALVMAPAPAQAADLECGAGIRLNPVIVPGTPALVRHGAQASPSAGGTTITLVAGPGLAANASALAAWQSAVAIWESRLGDNVTLVIEGDLQPMAPNILGATDFRLFSDTYDAIRNAMASDAAADETVLAGLPTFAQLSVALAPLFSFTGDMIASKANLRALGFDMSFDDPEPDGVITFNSDLASSFDYDPSDGIAPGTYDFEAIVVHEIGHALGFYTQIDIIDLLVASGFPGGAFMTPLDALRMRPGEGAADFTLNPRLLADGTSEPDQVTHDGVADRAMSTGQQVGDGYQASHWKADEVSGVFIGIMDPTLAAGVREELTAADLRAFGLMGWDMVPSAVGVPGDGDGVTARLHVAPNPLRSATTLRFSLASPGPVRVEVFDVRGRQVASPVQASFDAGDHAVRWNGRDHRGRLLSGGVYYARLVSPAGETVVKLVKLD